MGLTLYFLDWSVILIEDIKIYRTYVEISQWKRIKFEKKYRSFQVSVNTL